MASEDYWPDNLLEDLPTTPAEVLADVASGLGKKTRNLIVAEVNTSAIPGGDFVIWLILKVPTLDDYQYHLLRLDHDNLLYPVTTDEGQQLSNEQELREYAKRILSSEKTAKIIKALIAQAKNPLPTPPDSEPRMEY